jgi:hypothetical protein
VKGTNTDVPIVTVSSTWTQGEVLPTETSNIARGASANVSKSAGCQFPTGWQYRFAIVEHVAPFPIVTLLTTSVVTYTTHMEVKTDAFPGGVCAHGTSYSYALLYTNDAALQQSFNGSIAGNLQSWEAWEACQ